MNPTHAMTRLNFSFSQNLYQWYQEFWIRYYFKFVLPKITTTTLEGIRLDLSNLSLKVRNRILNVGYEDQEKAMCRDFLKREDSVLEIGGAIGFIGLFCRKKLGLDNFISVEANPLTVEILKKNYDLNGVTPQVWNVALGKSDGVVQLNVGGDFWENFIVYSEEKSRVNTIEVPCATLSSLLQRAGRKINVLIIDIEGAEQFIDFEQIPETIDKVIIEIHPHVLGQEMAYNIVSTLIGKGFRVAREEGDTYAFLRRSAPALAPVR
jgi:FkbM family methyltransferase